ncbi:MAG: acyl-CoA synthetase [Pseudomonadota bacterium]
MGGFHPSIHAAATPDKPALIMGNSGERLSFKELDERSNQIAHAFREAGLQPGDTIALLAENSLAFFEVCWAAQRSGLYYVCISTRLRGSEAAYILSDCGASLFIAGASLSDVAKDTAEEAGVTAAWSIDGAIDGFTELAPHSAHFPTSPIADEMAGTDMLYSSGTTGRPKGIRPALVRGKPIDEDTPLSNASRALCRIKDDSTYLSPAPLYHAAPLRWCMSLSRAGMTLIIMEKFDAEAFLSMVERYKVTHTQLVPSMFVRMLKLPEEDRTKYDVSSIDCAIHAAAPCPIPVKEQMIDWWGPVLEEYYAGSEGNGICWINSQEWSSHKGSVGKAIWGELHICDEAGDEVPIGQEGQIYFGGTPAPQYHNDPEKTKSALNPKHPDWSSLGDVGKVDEDGFLYLTDRKAFMIISGGVNIYPQESENILITHPKVADCAVIGVPDEDFGEAVKAVVQPMDGVAPSEELAEELLDFCRANLSKIKCPKSVDFDPELPRHPNGKLYKRLIRDRYRGKSDSGIV